jgi:large subunit ribosomal protein L9
MAQVKLILRESVPSLGEAGELVSVRPGFARNYLIPQGKAVFATDANVQQFEHQKRVIAERVAKQRSELEKLKARLEGLDLEVRVRAGEEGKLFGSVTAIQIAELLAERGFDLDRRILDLPEPIKDLGEHRVPVKLHRDVIAQVRVRVTPEA